MAIMREDLDAVENETQRNVILIRRLKSEQKPPSGKAELNEFLKTAAVKLLADIGVPEDAIKFVTLAYNSLDQAKQSSRKGTLPAFKIGFKSKETAVEFREKGAKLAKDKDHKLSKVGFAFQQCSGSRIRISIMWQIVTKLKEDGRDAWVNATSNKPKLQIKTGDKYPKDYNFVEAITAFGQRLTAEDLKEPTQQAKKFFKGQVEQIFVVLKE